MVSSEQGDEFSTAFNEMGFHPFLVRMVLKSHAKRFTPPHPSDHARTMRLEQDETGTTFPGSFGFTSFGTMGWLACSVVSSTARQD